MDNIQVLEGDAANIAVERLNSVLTIGSGEDGSPDIALLKQAGYVVAPVMYKGTLSEDLLKIVFDAAKTTGIETMTAIGLYSTEEQHCYELPMTLEALNELRGTSCGVINFALFGTRPEGTQPDWLVLFDDQIYVGYGSEAFVTALVGNIEAAFKAIEDKLNQLYQDAQSDIPGYAKAEINRMGEYLDAALGKLANDYAKAEAGERVMVV
ncbi:MAG: hypothetical protein AAFQ63_08300 [Cyanobacteria bacterium J06621_11]